MPWCKNCGGFVTRDFARVFGDADHTVHACPDCDSIRKIIRGSGAGLQFSTRPVDGQQPDNRGER